LIRIACVCLPRCRSKRPKRPWCRLRSRLRSDRRSFRRRYTTAKAGIPASDRSRFVRTDKVAGRSGKRTRLAWKSARRAERSSGRKSA
jgi:hypothetical protein